MVYGQSTDGMVLGHLSNYTSFLYLVSIFCSPNLYLLGIFKGIFDNSEQKQNQREYKSYFDSLSELNQINSIYQRTLLSDSNVATEAASTVHRLLVSQIGYTHKSLYHCFKYIDLKKNDLKKFSVLEPDVRSSLYCIASMNHNGYVREEALRYLIQSPTDFTFPFILFRLADWVPPIKSLAEEGVQMLIRDQDPRFFIQHHKTIDWLLKIERSNLKDIHQEITDFIFSEENVDLLLNTSDSYEDGDRFYIFKNTIARNTLRRDVFLKILEDKTHLIRLLAVKNIQAIDQPEILKKLLKDRSRKIRTYAVSKIPEAQIDQFQTELNRLLFDISAEVRNKSRMLLSKVSTYNFPEIYRQAISNSPSIGRIIGLSEVGNESDIEMIYPFITSDSTQLRAASLYALANLNDSRVKELAFNSLYDSSNTVKKVGVNLITKDKTRSDLGPLRDIYSKGSTDTKRYVLKAISEYGGWSIAGDFITAINEDDENLNTAAYALLNNWFSYSSRLYTELSNEDKQYVMEIYQSLNLESKEHPTHIKELLTKIPFIFESR